MIVVVTIGLLILSFMAKAFMDISSKDGWDKSWLNKTESWQNKYVFPLIKGYKHWWYFGLLKPIYKERFMFSYTILVAFTCGWHLFQFIFLNCMFMALALNMGWCVQVAMIYFVVIRFIYAIVFNSFYK